MPQVCPSRIATLRYLFTPRLKRSLPPGKDLKQWQTVHALSRSQSRKEKYPAKVTHDLTQDAQGIANKVEGVEAEYLYTGEDIAFNKVEFDNEDEEKGAYNAIAQPIFFR